MDDLLDYIVKNLVSNPQAVSISQEEADNSLTFKLSVDPSDMGMVIGKGGQTIRAIRKLLVARALAENPSLRVYLNLNEDHHPDTVS